jgi:ABC transporter DrrB family efflux protein
MADASVIALPQSPNQGAVNTGAGLWISSLTVAGRMVRKFARTPQLIMFTTIQSALFLLMFRFAFGGAIKSGGALSYVDYMVPGFITTTIMWSGAGSAVGMADDVDHGFVDRLRSLPIPRVSVLTGRALADATLMLWSLVTATVFGFIVGFRLTGSVPNALAAFGLCVLFGLAFEWVFIVIGLVAGTSQSAQSMSLIVVPLIFLSSAYVPSTGMPPGVKQFGEYEPLTPMVNSVRNLAMGPDAQALLPHGTGYYIGLSLAWTAGIFVVFGFLAFLRFTRR